MSDTRRATTITRDFPGPSVTVGRDVRLVGHGHVEAIRVRRVKPVTACREQFGGLLSALRDLMLGGRHNRHTLVRQFRISVPTADRWLQAFTAIPGVFSFKVSKTRWYEWRAPVTKQVAATEPLPTSASPARGDAWPAARRARSGRPCTQ